MNPSFAPKLQVHIMAGRKGALFGGSGAKESSTKHYQKALKQASPTFKPKEFNHYVGNKMSESDLETYLMGDTVQCLECGLHYKHLSLHLHYSHLMTREDYCIKYGIPPSTTLVGQSIRKSISNLRKEEFDNLDEEKRELIRKKLRTLNTGKSLLKRRNAVCPKCNERHLTKSGRVDVLCKKCLKDSNLQAKEKHAIKTMANADLIKCPCCSKDFRPQNAAKIFRLNQGYKLYCSRKCYLTSLPKRISDSARKSPLIEKTCPSCNSTFKKKERLKAIFCSRKCYLSHPKDADGKFPKLIS